MHPDIAPAVAAMTWDREGVLCGMDCGMRKLEKVYFAEFHLLNVPQITP